MNRYKFITAKSVQVTNQDLAKAKEITNVDDILKASKCIGEYVFEMDDELTKVFSGANSISLVEEILPNGNSINRAVAILTSGAKYRLRVFGSKVLRPAKDFTKEEITKLKFGFCTSDGERVTENKVSGDTGELIRVPVMYVNIA